MRTAATLVISKGVGAVSRWVGRGGGQALPGLVAERLDPQLVRKLSANLPHGVILVTGTNGKTTTTKLISEMLEAAGERVLTNSTGSNLKRGIASALIRAASTRGKFSQTIGLFEVDEANLRLVAPLTQPKLIVVLNLFRDQLDRYGELDTTAGKIGAGIEVTRADLVLNADDPLVASLGSFAGEGANVTYFGIEHVAKHLVSKLEVPVDSDRCLVCKKPLHFRTVFYGHLGHWECPDGHVSRPEPTVVAQSVTKMDLDGVSFRLRANNKDVAEAILPLPGLYNVYNAVAAVATGRALGVSLKDAARSIEQTEAAFGRVERIQVKDRTVYLLLIKNPAGFAQVVETFLMQQPGSQLLMVINDLDADGRDVSWLWDVPLEPLSRFRPKVLTSGIRAADMALRLKYADIEAEPVASLQQALAASIAATPEGGNLFVLPTYTAMLNVRKVLSKMTQIEDVWK